MKQKHTLADWTGRDTTRRMGFRGGSYLNIETKLAEIIRKYIHFIYVPECCTSVAQPNDRCLNSSFKSHLKNRFRIHFDGNDDIDNFEMNLRPKKPTRPEIVLYVIQALARVPGSAVRQGFRMAAFRNIPDEIIPDQIVEEERDAQELADQSTNVYLDFNLQAADPEYFDVQ